MFFSNILQVSYDFDRTFPSKGHKGQSECEFEYARFYSGLFLTLKLKLTLFFLGLKEENILTCSRGA